jgi:glycosyltransferase involved in cell wall biosynthesis
MRIQLFCAAFPPRGRGGGPVGAELIAQALVSSGHEIEVLTVSDEEHQENRGEYQVYSLGSPNIYADYWRANPVWKKIIWHLLENFNPVAFVRAHRRIRRFQPDLVMTVSIENINVATWIAAKRNGLPVVHVVQNLFILCWRGCMYARGRKCKPDCKSCRILSLGRRLAAKYVDAIIGETSFVNSSHTNRSVFTKARQYVVPGPIDPLVAARSDAIVIPRRQNHLTIGYIGNINYEKGVLTLARAARKLCENLGDKIRFRIAGTGKESVLAELRAQFPPQVTQFVGWTMSSAFYQSVDVVVVPSLLSEAFGRTSVEPLAYGVPVVVARSGGLPENVEEGISGLVFTPGDDRELARLLAELAGDKARLQALSKGALARASCYSFSKFSSTLDRIVTQVCQETRYARRDK